MIDNTIDGSALGAGDTLSYDGSSETDGHLVLNGGAGADVLTGGAVSDTIVAGGGNDTINLQQGGNDTVSGGGAADTFQFGATLTAADAIDGGTGSDNVQLKGDYSAGVTFAATTMVNVEKIILGAERQGEYHDQKNLLHLAAPISTPFVETKYLASM